MTTLEQLPLPADIRELQERKTAEFLAQGLGTLVAIYKRGEECEPHAHAATTIVTLAGSALIRFNEENIWELILPGDETEIADGEVHEEVAGNGGWIYLFTCSQEQARRHRLAS